MFLQTERSKRTCAEAGEGITVDKSRTTVFFRLLAPAFDDSAGSVGGSTRRSAEPTCVKSL